MKYSHRQRFVLVIAAICCYLGLVVAIARFGFVVDTSTMISVIFEAIMIPTAIGILTVFIWAITEATDE